MTESGKEELGIWKKTTGFSEAALLSGLNKVKHALLAMSGTACAQTALSWGLKEMPTKAGGTRRLRLEA